MSERFEKHFIIFNDKMMLLSKKYDMKDLKLIEDSYSYVLGRLPQNNSGSNLSSDCGWRYNLCITAAGAGAILCHAGCDTTALATTAGLGIPACVALCSTIQVAASVQCYDTYCK